MKIILIDDEPIALDVLQHMLSTYEDIDIIGIYTRPLDALESIKEAEPDVIFLDIEMGEMNGLELAEIFMRKLAKVEIVFVTAYSQYAVDAFEINAIDYLLKPIQENRLFKAIERLRENLKENYIDDKDINSNKIKVQSFGGFQVLDSMGNPLTWRTQKSKELFAYLWERKERSVSKMLIMEDIFHNRDRDKAGTLLHTTIYQLRKNLKKLGYPNGIVYFDESYQLNVPARSDLEELNQIIYLKKHNDEDIKKVLEIYIGDFLEEGYHWAMEIQQIYREKILNIIEKFARRQLEEGRLSPILKESLDKAYEIDSFNDNVAEMMIHYYGKQNMRGSLDDFFNDYAMKLWKEMNLKPMQSTINIYKRYME